MRLNGIKDNPGARKERVRIGRGEGSEFYAPMSIAVIGGVITSTLLTLVVVPIFYVWFDRLTIRGRRERRERRLSITLA